MSTHPGHELKKVREAKGIALELAAKETCLRAGVLRALEESREVDGMTPVYERLSLRMYARYLGVPVSVGRTGKRSENSVSFSPVDGCIELAYSEDRRIKEAPKKRRRLKINSIFPVILVVVVASGLWSLNAKLSRLEFEEEAPNPALMVDAMEPTPLNLEQPPDSVTLDDTLFLTLNPSLPLPEDATSE